MWTSGRGGGGSATGRSSSIWRTIGSWTCCPSARRRASRPGSRSIRPSASSVGTGVRSMPRAFAMGPAGRPGCGSVSSGQKPARSGRGLPPRPTARAPGSRRPDCPSAHPGGRPWPVTPMYRGRHQCTPVQQQRQEAAQQQRHAAWVATYEAIHTLHAQGAPVTTIAQQLGISRPTVYAYLRRTRPRVPAAPSAPARSCGPTWHT